METNPHAYFLLAGSKCFFVSAGPGHAISMHRYYDTEL
jgi:hypothetical protein